MGLFDREENPIKIFEDNLMDAVKNGNTSAIKTLLETDMDVPAAVFNKALNKAIHEDKVKTVETLLSNKDTLWKVDDTYRLRNIVITANKPMFLALYTKGDFTFDAGQLNAGTSASVDVAIRLQVELWKKEIAYEALVEELQALKTEITAKGGQVPEIKKPDAAPSKKGGESFTM